MSYSTRAEVREMMKEDALNPAIGDTYRDEEEREAMIGPIIDGAIADADGEIDGYLAKRYAVPLSSPPGIINKLSKDIALFNVYSRMGLDEDSGQKIFLTRYNAAVKYLTLVAEGKASIGGESEDPSSAAAAGFSIHSSARLFSRGQMEGM